MTGQKNGARVLSNIAETVNSYKDKGVIGNTTPKSTKHAQKIATAIAYDKAGRARKT